MKCKYLYFFYWTKYIDKLLQYIVIPHLLRPQPVTTGYILSVAVTLGSSAAVFPVTPLPCYVLHVARDPQTVLRPNNALSHISVRGPAPPCYCA